MAFINLGLTTIPTPEPYSDKDEHKQRENLCFVLLQLFALGQSVGFKLPDKDEITLLTDKLDALIAALPMSGTGSPADLTPIIEKLDALIAAVNDLSMINIVREVNGERLDIFGRHMEST